MPSDEIKAFTKARARTDAMLSALQAKPGSQSRQKDLQEARKAERKAEKDLWDSFKKSK